MSAGAVITGLGVVSSLGSGAEAFRAAWRRRESGVRPLRVFASAEYRRDLAAEVPGFDPTPLLGKKGLKSCDRSTLLMLASTELLLRDAGLLDRDVRRAVVADEEIGIAVGTVGSIKSIADFDLETIRAPQFVMPTLFPNTVFCAAASYTAIRYGLKESCVTFTADETAALDAFAAGLGRLAQGRARHMVVGATHELSAIWALAYQKACERLGVDAPILGEGACAFSLEGREPALRRGAPVLAEVLGCASAFCPDKPRAFASVLRRLAAQAGEGALGDVRHLFTAQKADLDERAALGGSPEVHRLYPAVGYVSALTGGLATAAALADERIPAGATVLVSAADPAGGCAALLLRKSTF